MRRGFSLVELLVVIAIIVLILAVALPNPFAAVIREVQTIGQSKLPNWAPPCQARASHPRRI